MTSDTSDFYGYPFPREVLEKVIGTSLEIRDEVGFLNREIVERFSSNSLNYPPNYHLLPRVMDFLLGSVYPPMSHLPPFYSKIVSRFANIIEPIPGSVVFRKGLLLKKIEFLAFDFSHGFELSEGIEICSMAEGVVKEVNYDPSFENLPHDKVHETNNIIVENEEGLVNYFHIFPEVEKGQQVSRGMRLGVLGGYSNYPHLHVLFEGNIPRLEPYE